MKNLIQFCLSIVLSALFLTGCEVGITPLGQAGNEVNIVTTDAIDEDGNIIIRTEIPESAGDVDVSVEIYGPGSEYFIVELDENLGVYEGLITERPDNPPFYQDTTFYFFTRFVLNGQNQCEGNVTKTILRTEVAPVAKDLNITIDDNTTTVEIVLEATDRNNDTLEFNVTIEPINGELSGIAPFLTYTPDDDFFGTDSFTYVVNDGLSESDAMTVSITINNAVVVEASGQMIFQS